jgi:N-acetylmuramoyl-L-alanine amidase CwlA
VVSASAHYFVDDDSVTQSVPDLFTAWSVGGTKWKDCATTGGGTMYGKITNANSISVEMCDTLRNGTVKASEQTMANTASLVKDLMKKYNIDIDHVYRHFDVTGKHCPAYFMNASAWAEFKARLKDGDTVPNYKTLNDIPSWAKPTVEKLIAHGSLKGDANGELNLDRNMLRLLVINDREGCYGK